MRRIASLLTDPRLHDLVELAERSADERIAAKQMQQARLLAGLLREERADEEARQPNWMTRAARAAAQAVEALVQVKEPILQTPRDIREPPDVVSATRIARTAARAIEAAREERLGEPTPLPRRTGSARCGGIGARDFRQSLSSGDSRSRLARVE